MQTITYPSLDQPGCVAMTFSRLGGVSPVPYDSLNVGYHVGDMPGRVAENRERIRAHLGLAALASCQQVHGDRVLVVEETGLDGGQTKGQSPVSSNEPSGYDALVTERRGIGLMVQQADCQAVLLLDPARPAVAAIHSGWRGSVANIIAKTISTMTDLYNTDPARLRAAISPSLGPCCGEFVNYRDELPTHLHHYRVSEHHFDFWAVSREQLMACGVPAEQITTAAICTVCSPDFFSYRRDRTTGRFTSVIGLRP